MFGKGGERRFRAEIRLIDSGACGPGFFRAALSALNSQTKLRVGDTTRNQKSMVGKGEERRFRAEIRLGDSGVWACVCARLSSCCCLLSIPRRNFVCGTPLGSKRVWLAKVGNDDFGPKSAWEILVCVCVRARLFSWCCLLLWPLNSQTKPRLGDTTRNQKSMFGKGGERRCRAEIRLGDSGACACVCPFFRGALSSLVASQFPNETSIGRHHWESKEYVWQR